MPNAQNGFPVSLSVDLEDAIVALLTHRNIEGAAGAVAISAKRLRCSSNPAPPRRSRWERLKTTGYDR